MKTGSLLFLALVGLVACSGDDSNSDSGSAGDDLVGTILAKSAKVEPDRIVFPKEKVTANLRGRIDKFERAIASGQAREGIESVVLVGDRQDDATDASGQLRKGLDNPYGYLRRAL